MLVLQASVVLGQYTSDMQARERSRLIDQGIGAQISESNPAAPCQRMSLSRDEAHFQNVGRFGNEEPLLLTGQQRRRETEIGHPRFDRRRHLSIPHFQEPETSLRKARGTSLHRALYPQSTSVG